MSNIQKLTIEQKSYIAGFLDGDGSIFAQIIRDKNVKYGFRIRVSIGFYQKKTKHWFILKLKKFLKYGYVRIRKDNISEYIITCSSGVHQILLFLKNFVILKKKNDDLVIKIIEKTRKINSKKEFIETCKLVDKVADLNYSKNRKITSSIVEESFKSI